MARDESSIPTVGIVGAGQLARMMVQASIPLGIDICLLAERENDSAALVSPTVLIGSPMSADSLATLVSRSNVVTFDHELVDPQVLAHFEASGARFRPTAATMALAQNKRRQRAELGALGFPVPANRPVTNAGDILAFGTEHGWPVVVKAGRGGYDGRGVWVLDGPDAVSDLAAQVSNTGLELLVEARVPIERELAVLVARRAGGEAVVYPAVETVQRDGICHETVTPAQIKPSLATEAERLALAIAEAIGAVGILAVELFVTNGRLIVNELAARPHNSGHWTIEGSITSQFEQHLRAVLNWPLGLTNLISPVVATVNLLGGPEGVNPVLRLSDALAINGAHVHLYGKEARPGRKLGHVTALGSDLTEVRERARRAATLLTGRISMEATA